MVVVHLTDEDRRPAVLHGLGLPAVLLGTWDEDPQLPTVRTDDTSPVLDVVGRLTGLGHQRIARVTGPAALRHTRARTAALIDGCRAAGAAEPVVVEGDYSAEAGARLTAELLRRPKPPPPSCTTTTDGRRRPRRRHGARLRCARPALPGGLGRLDAVPAGRAGS